LVENMRWADYLHFCQFVDYGKGDNLEFADPSPSEISSVGLGLRWGASFIKLPFELRTDAEIYWGYKLKDVEDYDDSGPQDDGIHYQLALTGFF
jgi:hemolysin activation/secretion protein